MWKLLKYLAQNYHTSSTFLQNCLQISWDFHKSLHNLPNLQFSIFAFIVLKTSVLILWFQRKNLFVKRTLYLFIWVYGSPKYDESVKISQAPKSLFPSAVRKKEHRRATSPQTGQQPTDGLLVAQRRNTSPETGYYEIVGYQPTDGQQPRDGIL